MEEKREIELTEKEKMFAEGMCCVYFYIAYLLKCRGIDICCDDRCDDRNIMEPQDIIYANIISMAEATMGIGVKVQYSFGCDIFEIDLSENPETIRQVYAAWVDKRWGKRLLPMTYTHHKKTEEQS